MPKTASKMHVETEGLVLLCWVYRFSHKRL